MYYICVCSVFCGATNIPFQIIYNIDTVKERGFDPKEGGKSMTFKNVLCFSGFS